MKLFCLCGHVSICVERRPDYINECNCSLCRKAGARWGYFHPSEVKVEGRTKGYRRADKEAPNADVRFCDACGSTTHFVLTEGAVSKFGDTLMGVNMWLADEGDLTGLQVRYPDGRAWSGVGGFSYVRKAKVLG